MAMAAACPLRTRHHIRIQKLAGPQQHVLYSISQDRKDLVPELSQIRGRRSHFLPSWVSAAALALAAGEFGTALAKKTKTASTG
jgi:hypothetical protein